MPREINTSKNRLFKLDREPKLDIDIPNEEEKKIMLTNWSELLNLLEKT